jgi:hypothetical protein
LKRGRFLWSWWKVLDFGFEFIREIDNYRK